MTSQTLCDFLKCETPRCSKNKNLSMAYFGVPSQKTYLVHAQDLPSRVYLPYPYALVNNNALRLAGARFEQKPSLVQGNGLFSTEEIPARGLIFSCSGGVAEADEFTCLMNGTIFKPSPEMERHIDTLPALKQSVRTYLLVAERTRNIAVTDDGELRATRRIRKGEELWKIYDIDFWLMELITISDATTANKRFGHLVAQCLDESPHPVTHLHFPVKTGGTYRNWVAYWGREGESVMAYGKSILEKNYTMLDSREQLGQ